MQQGTYLPKSMYDNPAAPALGEYILTKGSIAHSLEFVICGDHVALNEKLSSQLTTIGQLSAYIIATQPGIQAGDIFTLVIAESDLLPGDQLMGDTPPGWETIQFFIDPNDVNTLASVNLVCEEDESSGDGYYLHTDINAVDRASFAAFTISRNTSTGLKVSNTSIIVSPAAAAIIDWHRGEYAKREAAISWGGNPEAFLQGGQLDNLPNLNNVSVGNVASAPYAYGAGMFNQLGSVLQFAATLQGNGLRTTAQGAKYTFTFYNAAAYGIDIAITLVKPRLTCELTATGTATSLSLTGSIDNNIFLAEETPQGYGLLTCDGVPVWWGAMLKST